MHPKQKTTRPRTMLLKVFLATFGPGVCMWCVCTCTVHRYLFPHMDREWRGGEGRGSITGVKSDGSGVQ